MAKKKVTKSTLPVAEISSPAPRRQTKEDIELEKRWRAEEDLRTLQRASDIKKDKERMKCMQDYAKEQMKVAASASKIAGNK